MKNLNSTMIEKIEKGLDLNEIVPDYTSPNPILRKYCWLRLYRSIQMINSYIKPPMRILDAGCGAGYLLELLNKNFKNIFLVGIDYNKNIVKLSQKPFYLIQGDLRSLPLKERSVDMIFCLDVLEHIKEPVKAIVNLKKVLKKMEN